MPWLFLHCQVIGCAGVETAQMTSVIYGISILARLDEVQEELLYYPGVGVNVKVFYVMGKALSGELSCPFDRSYSKFLDNNFQELKFCILANSALRSKYHKSVVMPEKESIMGMRCQ